MDISPLCQTIAYEPRTVVEGQWRFAQHLYPWVPPLSCEWGITNAQKFTVQNLDQLVCTGFPRLSH